MKKKGILLLLLALLLLMTVGIAAAEESTESVEKANFDHWIWCDAPDVCAGCGIAISDLGDEFYRIEHRGPSAYKYDNTQHWLICSSCGQPLIPRMPHYTYCVDESQSCYICHAQNVVMERIYHYLESTTSYTYDATSHWKVCENCGEIFAGPVAHRTFDGDPEGICSVCGASYGPPPAPVQLNSISISGSQTVGSSVTATVSATGATYYSYWVYDGQGALVSEAYMTTSSSYSFTPAKPGIYNVFVAVTDGLTTAQENSGWFPVQGDPVVIHSFSVSGDKKPGSSLTATVSAPGATGFSYWFYNADGTLLEEAYMVTTSTYTFTPPVAGGYNIFVAVTDGVSGAQQNSGWFLVQ